MADNTNTQRSLLMLWLLMITNNDLFAPQEGMTPADSLLANVDSIDGIDSYKQKLVTAALSPGYVNHFIALRTLYQSVSQTPLFWPPLPGEVAFPEHPTLEELEEIFFRPPQ